MPRRPDAESDFLAGFAQDRSDHPDAGILYAVVTGRPGDADVEVLHGMVELDPVKLLVLADVLLEEACRGLGRRVDTSATCRAMIKQVGVARSYLGVREKTAEASRS